MRPKRLNKAAAEPVEPVEPPKPAPKKVIAMRGDDRPGMKKAEPAPAGKFGDGKFGDRKPGVTVMAAQIPVVRRSDGRGDRVVVGDRFATVPPIEDRGPRLGDAAFRAQRDALEHAQLASKSWPHRPTAKCWCNCWTPGKPAMPPKCQARRIWASNCRQRPQQLVGRHCRRARRQTGRCCHRLLRLEMAAEVPTPAEHLADRRMLQLQLLTKRNDPAPAQTWAEDAAKVLASDFDDGTARRVQNVLKVLLKRYSAQSSCGYGVL